MTGPDNPYPYFPPAPQPPPRKKHPVRKWLIIASATFAGIIAAVIVVGLAVGSAANHAANPVSAHSSAPAPPSSLPGEIPASTTAPSGPDILTPGGTESVGSGDTPWAAITVESVAVTTRPAQAYANGPANGYFVVVHVKATADPSYTGGFDINELDFYDLVHGSHYAGGGGNSYGALSDSQSNADITATLAAGETSTGWMAFDVPSRHGYIVYSPNLDGQPIAEWQY